jgi:Alpha/beta hydrolase domain
VIYVSLLRVAILALSLYAFVPKTAEAAINKVTVNTSRPFEHRSAYTYAEITIDGSVMRSDGTAGQYSVPAVIIFPRSGHGNGVGVVDWLGTSFYHFFPATTDANTIQFTRLATENYLFEQRYTYLSIQWDKAVTEIFGPAPPANDGANHLAYGSIERGADAWEILLDAARLLKDPGAYPGRFRPARVATVLSSGYSQGAALQLEMLAERLDPRRVYDGHLIQMIGLVCWKRDDTPPFFGSLGACAPLPTSGHHAPVMVLTSESDMLAFHSTVLGVGKSGYFTRNAHNPNWRQYELAGVSHIPAPVFPLGLPIQNSADPRPAFRAAFANLKRWTHGDCTSRPPASRHFKGHVDATDAFVPTLDADGHFSGGLRLPHVDSEISGRTAGAALGQHRPLNTAASDVFALLGGTFARFRPEEILARYPVQHSYVKRVRRAADHLAARDYIIDQDREALIAAAEDEPLYDTDGND